MTQVFECNPDESAGLAEEFSPETAEGFSVKVCRYVAYSAGADRDIAECDDKTAIGTMLVQLAEDAYAAGLEPDRIAIWDRLESRWVTRP